MTIEGYKITSEKVPGGELFTITKKGKTFGPFANITRAADAARAAGQVKK